MVVSRPEHDLVISSSRCKPLKNPFIVALLWMMPTNQIAISISSLTSSRKSRKPKQSLEKLVRKLSGQSIFAATVIRFVQSNRHRPTGRLEIILLKTTWLVAKTSSPGWMLFITTFYLLLMTYKPHCLFSASISRHPTFKSCFMVLTRSKSFCPLNREMSTSSLRHLSSIVSYEEPCLFR
jgi:hypothetical protein